MIIILLPWKNRLLGVGDSIVHAMA